MNWPSAWPCSAALRSQIDGLLVVDLHPEPAVIHEADAGLGARIVRLRERPPRPHRRGVIAAVERGQPGAELLLRRPRAGRLNGRNERGGKEEKGELHGGSVVVGPAQDNAASGDFVPCKGARECLHCPPGFRVRPLTRRPGMTKRRSGRTDPSRHSGAAEGRTRFPGHDSEMAVPERALTATEPPTSARVPSGRVRIAR